MLCLDAASFLTDRASSAVYTLSLHDALPIFVRALVVSHLPSVDARDDGTALLEATVYTRAEEERIERRQLLLEDRKSTRLNSSHLVISYAVFCLKKKIRNHGHKASQQQDIWS